FGTAGRVCRHVKDTLRISYGISFCVFNGVAHVVFCESVFQSRAFFIAVFRIERDLLAGLYVVCVIPVVVHSVLCKLELIAAVCLTVSIEEFCTAVCMVMSLKNYIDIIFVEYRSKLCSQDHA